MGSFPAGTRQKGSMSFLDAGGKRGSFHGWFPIITAGNEVAQAALWATLLGAADDLALGVRVSDTYNDTTTYVGARPTNGATRTVGLKVIYMDGTTGQTWESILPTLNIALISYISNLSAKEVVDQTTTEVAAFVAALNAMPPKNPYVYANSGTVVDLQVIRGLR